MGRNLVNIIMDTCLGLLVFGGVWAGWQLWIFLWETWGPGILTIPGILPASWITGVTVRNGW